MEMISVESKNIAAAGYSPGRKLLRLRFHDGPVWDYEQVEQSEYDAFMAAPSKNAYFRAHIRGVKPATRSS